MKFTVAWVNGATQNWGYRGTFDTLEAATEYANREARQSRTVMTFEVWKGTPKAPSEPVPATRVQGKA